MLSQESVCPIFLLEICSLNGWNVKIIHLLSSIFPFQDISSFSVWKTCNRKQNLLSQMCEIPTSFNLIVKILWICVSLRASWNNRKIFYQVNSVWLWKNLFVAHYFTILNIEPLICLYLSCFKEIDRNCVYNVNSSYGVNRGTYNRAMVRYMDDILLIFICLKLMFFFSYFNTAQISKILPIWQLKSE